MPLLLRKRLLAASAEGTPGTAETVDATDAAFNVFNCRMNPEIDVEQRELQGGFGMLPADTKPRRGRCQFATNIYGGAAEPVWAALFLPAVGLGYTDPAYVLDDLPPEAASTTQQTITLASYEDGRRKCLYGAMGNMKLTLPAGKLAMAEFDFLGIWQGVTDAAMPDPTYPTTAPMRVVSSALTVGARTPIVGTVTLDLGNELYLLESVSGALGYASTVVANRLVTGTMDPASALVASMPWYDDIQSGAEASLSVVITDGTYTCTITATELQSTNVQDADRNKVQVDALDFQLNADDLTLTFSAPA